MLRMIKADTPAHPLHFLRADSSMAAVIRATRWDDTVFGPVSTWPQSLQSALSICLGSSFPIAIYWGPDLGLVYNDDWSPILGSKHPWALGRGWDSSHRYRP